MWFSHQPYFHNTICHIHWCHDIKKTTRTDEKNPRTKVFITFLSLSKKNSGAILDRKWDTGTTAVRRGDAEGIFNEAFNEELNKLPTGFCDFLSTRQQWFPNSSPWIHSLVDQVNSNELDMGRGGGRVDRFCLRLTEPVNPYERKTDFRCGCCCYCCSEVVEVGGFGMHTLFTSGHKDPWK